MSIAGGEIEKTRSWDVGVEGRKWKLYWSGNGDGICGVGTIIKWNCVKNITVMIF